MRCETGEMDVHIPHFTQNLKYNNKIDIINHRFAYSWPVGIYIYNNIQVGIKYDCFNVNVFKFLTKRIKNVFK